MQLKYMYLVIFLIIWFIINRDRQFGIFQIVVQLILVGESAAQQPENQLTKGFRQSLIIKDKP